jgi:hypothetical protein
MKYYAEPLKRRIYRAKWMRERYRKDSAWRLAEINRKRAYYGRPPCSSLDEVRGRI